MKLLQSVLLISCLIACGHGANQVPGTDFDQTVTDVPTVSNIACTTASPADVKTTLQPCFNAFKNLPGVDVSSYNSGAVRDYIQTLVISTFRKSLSSDLSEITKLCTVSFMANVCARETITACSNQGTQLSLQRMVDGDPAYRIASGGAFCKAGTGALNSLFKDLYTAADVNSCFGSDALDKLLSKLKDSLAKLQANGASTDFSALVDFKKNKNMDKKKQSNMRAAQAQCNLVNRLGADICRALRKNQCSNSGKDCKIETRNLIFLLAASLSPPGCQDIGKGGPKVGNSKGNGKEGDDVQKSNAKMDPCRDLIEDPQARRNKTRTNTFVAALGQVGIPDDQDDESPLISGLCGETKPVGSYFTLLETDRFLLQAKMGTINGKTTQYFSGIKLSISNKDCKEVAAATFEDGNDVKSFSSGDTEIKSGCDDAKITFKYVSKTEVTIMDKCSSFYLKVRFNTTDDNQNLYSMLLRAPVQLVGSSGSASGDAVTGCVAERAADNPSRRRRATSDSSAGYSSSQVVSEAQTSCGASCANVVNGINNALAADALEAKNADAAMTSSARAQVIVGVKVLFLGAMFARILAM